MSSSCFDHIDIETTFIPEEYIKLKDELFREKTEDSIARGIKLRGLFDKYSQSCKAYCDTYHKGDLDIKCIDFLPYEFLVCVSDMAEAEAQAISKEELVFINRLLIEFNEFFIFFHHCIEFLQGNDPKNIYFEKINKKLSEKLSEKKIHDIYPIPPVNFQHSAKKGGKRKSKRKNRRMKTKRILRRQRISKKNNN